MDRLPSLSNLIFQYLMALFRLNIYFFATETFIFLRDVELLKTRFVRRAYPTGGIFEFRREESNFNRQSRKSGDHHEFSSVLHCLSRFSIK